MQPYPLHQFDIEIKGDRYVGKTQFFNSVVKRMPPTIIIPSSPGAPYLIPVGYKLWEGNGRKPDITIMVVDPSRPETLQTVTDTLIPLAFLGGTILTVVLINHIPNRIEKMTMTSVRDYIQTHCKLYSPVYILEGDVDRPEDVERVLRTILSIRLTKVQS